MSYIILPQKNILDNWNPIKWGFTIEQTQSDEGCRHTYYKLEVTEEINIHVSCSSYRENPDIKVEQAVEIEMDGHYELLAHINTRQKMAQLIRMLSGKPHILFI